MIGFDIWWQNHAEELELTWEEMQIIKEIAQEFYEQGFKEGSHDVDGSY